MKKLTKIAFIAFILMLCVAFADEISEAQDLDAVYIGESVISSSVEDGDAITEILDVQSKTPSKSVSVIGKNKLLESSSGTGSILSTLENVPGATYDRSNGIGGTLVMRGMSSRNDRTIIAIDGVKIEGRPVLEFHLMDQYAFDAIEVIRGAASTIYGSNAMNGVINFKTRRWNGNVSAPFTIDAKIRALEYNSVNNGITGRAELLGGGNGFDLLIGLSGRKGEDFMTPEGRAKNSSYSSWGLDWNLGYTHSNIRYYTMGRFQRVYSNEASYVFSRPGSSFGLYMSELPLQEIFLRAGLEAYNPGIFADKVEAYIFWNRYDTDIEVDTMNLNNITKIDGTKGNGGQKFHRFVYNSDVVGAKVNFDKNIANNAISYGLDIWNEINATPNRIYCYDSNSNGGTSNTCNKGTTTSVSRDSYEIQIAPYIKDDWSVLDGLILSAGLRYDYLITIIGKKRKSGEDATTSAFLDKNHLTHQGAVTGNLGIVYYFNDLFSIVAGASHNFKSPGTSGFFPSVEIEANHDIKPEYAQTGELGLRFHSDNHYVSLVGYYTNYMNMIQNISVGNNKKKDVNIGRAFVAGVEFESTHKISDFDLGLVLAFTHGQNLSANKPLAYIAPLSGRITLGYNFDWGKIKWVQRAYMGKYRIDSSQERKSKSYTMSDISLLLKMGYFHENFKDMELIIGIDNLFNQKGRNPSTQEDPNYAYAISNPLLEPGINASVKLVYKY